jgi:hypothetical protein
MHALDAVFEGQFHDGKTSGDSIGRVSHDISRLIQDLFTTQGLEAPQKLPCEQVSVFPAETPWRPSALGCFAEPNDALRTFLQRREAE